MAYIHVPRQPPSQWPCYRRDFRLAYLVDRERYKRVKEEKEPNPLFAEKLGVTLGSKLFRDHLVIDFQCTSLPYLGHRPCDAHAYRRIMSVASPVNKPRLPSPPPFTEVQIGPKSPGVGAPVDASNPEREVSQRSDHGAIPRVRPGTKAIDVASGPPLRLLNEIDSPFQLQEHLKALFHHYTRATENKLATTQLTRETALKIATPPDGVDRLLWLFELSRLLEMKANELVVQFFSDNPPCSAQTCPEMRASEWQYLCAVHEPPKPCCAIDYCTHTLDWAEYTLSSLKHFPSRLTLGSDANGGSAGGERQIINIMRRVYRIFAHAWFQHRQVFWQNESSEGVYMLFKTVCDVHHLIPEENYTIPSEAEGLPSNKEEEKREGKAVLREQGTEDIMANDDGDAPTTISTGATTRRHKATPSFSSSVTAIVEGDEDDAPTDPLFKTKIGGPLENLADSLMKEAPLAQISKSAEKKDEQVAAAGGVESGDTGQGTPDEPAEMGNITGAASKDDGV
ncbi:hypothetical protein ACLMJK_005170 [Lecanora helva]